jgi:DNA-binding NtrC family response regulator
MTQRILAVDDEVHMLRLLERVISEKTPYPIVTTNNPLEVPRLLEQETFDLILTDLKMPGMDGLDILRLVKEQGRPEEVIILTAFGSLETAVEALTHDVFDYITKPFKKEQILFTVNKAMRWQTLRREAEAARALFGREPYAEAERAFQAEYLRRISARCGDDPAAAARRAGLPLKRVAACCGRADGAEPS